MLQGSDQGNDQQRVQWEPKQRQGEVLDTVPMDGEEWSRVRSDGWHERIDLPGFYQKQAVSGLTKPCVLTIRSKDLAPAQPAAPKAPSAGLAEDFEQAKRQLSSLHLLIQGAAAKTALVVLERTLLGIQAQVEQQTEGTAS